MNTTETPNPPVHRLRLQFSLKSLLALMLISALGILLYHERSKSQTILELSRVTIEVYTDRPSFEKRLAGAVRCIDFEDIDTADSDVMEFKSNRYIAQGVVLQSPGGLFVGRTFGFKQQYPPVSGKNSFAPGPIGKNPGGNTMDVTFDVQSRTGLVAGVGITFIDVDYPSLGPSSLTVFGWDDRQLQAQAATPTANAGSSFCGIVAVDAHGDVIPAISRAQIVNGSGWPGVDAGEGVTLDDLVFGVPELNRVR